MPATATSATPIPHIAPVPTAERIDFTNIHLVHDSVVIHLDRPNQVFYLEHSAALAPAPRGAYALVEQYGYFVDYYDPTLHEFDAETGLVRWHLLSLDETFED